MPLYSQVPYIGPPRSYTSKKPKYFVVVHSTENDAPARNEANYAKNRTDGTSSHYYVDDTEVIQSLNTDYGANHVGSWQGNQHGISYEFVGRASWSRSTWLDRIDWDKAAASIRRDCATWGIPMRRLTVAQLDDLERGITTHNDCRLAFGGTDHTDPGSNFPMDHLITLINGGTDMELQDIKDLANTDNVFPAPRVDAFGNPLTDEQYEQNAFWKLSGLLQQTAEDVRTVRGDVKERHDGLTARMDAIESRLVQVLEAIAALDSGAVAAEEIVDEMAERLAAPAAE